jgi:DNA-binding beta-propeller fold protein YncE
MIYFLIQYADPTESKRRAPYQKQPDGSWKKLSDPNDKGGDDNVVYVFDTASGAVQTIPVGKEPHGLTVWPQPGRYSLGHTGNMR